MMIRSMVLSVALLAASVISRPTVAVRADQSTSTQQPVALSVLRPKTVATGIAVSVRYQDTQVLVTSSPLHRLLVAGGDQDAPTADSTTSSADAFALVDTSNYRLVARRNVGGDVIAAAFDDRRNVVYLAVTVRSATSNAPAIPAMETIWVIRASDGRVLKKLLIAAGTVNDIAAMVVDPPQRRRIR